MNHKTAYYRDIFGVGRDGPYHKPYDEEDIDYTGYHAYEHYMRWANFQKKHPHNAELLKELFGERDAMDIFRSMKVLTESKAKELVDRIRSKADKTSRLLNMSDC